MSLLKAYTTSSELFIASIMINVAWILTISKFHIDNGETLIINGIKIIKMNVKR